VVSTLAGIAPPYVLGVVTLVLFAGKLGWTPVIFDEISMRSWILPAFVLAAYPCAIVMRLFEGELENIMQSRYVLRARAMGFSAAAVILREALPNALTAALPGLANALAAFITGAFFVEVIFGVPGLGRLAYEAISNKDIELLAGLCMVFAVIIVSISAVLEISRLFLDPRLRGRDA
jgi:ABC-type dipeptide/oligopeptide/nickel transport system permease component